MRRFATICLLILFSSVYSGLGQVWKLPFLVQHLYTHQQKEGATLAHFLSEHYGKPHEDEDKADDMKLPFKAFLNSPTEIATAPMAKLEIGRPDIPEAPRFVPFHTCFVPSLFARQVFHPPRTV